MCIVKVKSLRHLRFFTSQTPILSENGVAQCTQWSGTQGVKNELLK